MTLVTLALVWLIVAWAFSNTIFTIGGQNLNLAWVMLMVGGWHFVAGIDTVDVEHLVSVSILGYPTKQVSGTFIIAPPGIFQLRLYKLATVEFEFPDEPEKLYHGDEASTPPGLKPPIRITFSDPHDNYPFGVSDAGVRKDDPMHRKLTQEVTPIVRWRILDAFDFERNIGTPERARGQMEDISVSFLNETLSCMTLAVAQLNQKTLNEKFEERLRDKTAHWGIDLIDGRIKYFNLSKKLNVAIQGIAQADANAQSRKYEGEGERDFLSLQGKGKGKAAEEELEGRGKGLKSIADSLGLDPQHILGAETARDIANGPSTKIVVGSEGVRQLVGIGTTIADQFVKPANTP